MSLTIPAALQPVLGSKYPHRPRLMFILRKAEGVSHAAFTQALGAWRQQWGFAVEFGSIIARAGAAMLAEQEQINSRFGAGGLVVQPYDGYASLDLECYAPTEADFERLLGIAKGCLDTLDAVIDKPGTVALAGVSNMVIPGAAPLSMILVLDRPESLTLEEYNTWWVHHADDHRRFNPAQVGYYQMHITKEFNEAAAQAAGVGTMKQCVIDFMCLGDLADAFPKPGGRTEEEGRALSADIAKHVSFASVSGSFFKEV